MTIFNNVEAVVVFWVYALCNILKVHTFRRNLLLPSSGGHRIVSNET